MHGFDIYLFYELKEYTLVLFGNMSSYCMQFTKRYLFYIDICEYKAHSGKIVNILGKV